MKAAGKPVTLSVMEGYNHFEVMDSIGHPYSLFGRAALEIMKLRRRDRGGCHDVRRIGRRSFLAGGAALAFTANGARAQSFPSGPVKIVTSVGPGSSPECAPACSPTN